MAKILFLTSFLLYSITLHSQGLYGNYKDRNFKHEFPGCTGTVQFLTAYSTNEVKAKIILRNSTSSYFYCGYALIELLDQNKKVFYSNKSDRFCLDPGKEDYNNVHWKNISSLWQVQDIRATLVIDQYDGLYPGVYYKLLWTEPQSKGSDFSYAVDLEALTSNYLKGTVSQQNGSRSSEFCSRLDIELLDENNSVFHTVHVEHKCVEQHATGVNRWTTQVNEAVVGINKIRKINLKIISDPKKPDKKTITLPNTKNICRFDSIPSGWVVIYVNSGQILGDKICDDFCANGYTIADFNSFSGDSFVISDYGLIPKGWEEVGTRTKGCGTPCKEANPECRTIVRIK